MIGSAAVTSTRRRDAVLDGVNPLSKIVAMVVLSIPLLLTIDWVSSAVAIAIELALIPLCGVAIVDVLRRCVPLLAFAPIAGVSMLLYAEPGGRVYAQFLLATISDDSIALAIAVALRVIALGLPTILLFSRVDATELADSLAQVGRLPARFVLGVVAGVRLLSLFLEDWRSMELARRARGVGDSGALRRFFSMAFVMLVFAVRRGSKLATAMEARGFGTDLPRSWARASTVSVRDAVFLLGCVAIMAVAIGAAVVAGTFRFVGS